MTAKEKAKDLIEKFKPFVDSWDYYRDRPVPEKEILAYTKEIALTCIDELISMNDDRIAIANYWEDVKKETECYNCYDANC